MSTLFAILLLLCCVTGVLLLVPLANGSLRSSGSWSFVVRYLTESFVFGFFLFLGAPSA